MRGEDIGGIADQRAHAGQCDFAPEVLVKGLSDQRSHVELEVAGVDDPPFGAVDDKGRTFGNRMRNRQEADAERSRFQLLGPGVGDGDGLVAVSVFRQLAARDIRSKCTGIDLGRTEPIKQMTDGPDVIFVGVGDEYRLKLIAPLLQPSDVGKDQIDTRRRIHIGKGNADVDEDQPLFSGCAVAVDIGVHADFPGTAEGEIDQPICGHILPCSRL